MEVVGRNNEADVAIGASGAPEKKAECAKRAAALLNELTEIQRQTGRP